MKLHGLLHELPPADLLKQLAAEEAEGVLAVATADASFRLRFLAGQIVAAVLWPPRASLRRHLIRYEALRPARLDSLEAEAALREVPPAELLGKAVGGAEAVRLLRSYNEEALHDFLATREGVFLFDHAAEPSIPPALCVVFDRETLLADATARREAEARLAAWIPALAAPLQLKLDPHRGQSSPLRTALAAKLRGTSQSREQLTEALPFEPHAIQLELARMVRDRLVESPTAAPTAAPRRRASFKRPRASLRLRPGRPPELVERLLLTASEVKLLEVLRSPQSLDSLCRASGIVRRDAGPMVEILRTTGLVEVEPPSALRTFGRPLAAAAAAAVVVLTVLAFDPADRSGAPSSPASVDSPVANVTPSAAPVSQLPTAVDSISPGPGVALSPTDPNSIFVYATASPIDQGSEASSRGLEGMNGENPDAGDDADGALPTQDRSAQTSATRLDHRVAADSVSPGIVSPGSVSPDNSDRPPERVAAAKPAPKRSKTSKPSRSRSQRSSKPSSRPRAETPPAPAEVVATAPAEAHQGRLLINAVPYGFVEINGEEKGATPVQLELPPGRYQLVLKRAGYAIEEREVIVEADTDRIESFTLRSDEEGKTSGD